MVQGAANQFEAEHMDERAALGSAFAATLLGVAMRDLDVMPVLGDRLLEELRKRGFAVYRQPEEPPWSDGS
jgi:hypothetical protein